MMARVFYLVLLCCILITSTIHAQCRKADRLFRDLAYQKAIALYQKCLDKEWEVETAARLAHCYRVLDQHEEAVQWYRTILASGEVASKYTYLLAEALYAQGKPEMAQPYAREYAQIEPSDPRGQTLLYSIAEFRTAFREDSTHSIELAPFNSDVSDYAPAWWKDQLVFSSERKSNGRKNQLSGGAYAQLFLIEDTLSANARPFSEVMQYEFHAGAACFSQDGQEMYFTRNREKNMVDGTAALVIWRSKQLGEGWSEPVRFAHNNPSFNTAHPALSPNGKWLVFASDRSTEEQGMDLYICQRQGNTWSSPSPLKGEINTLGQEVFPIFLNDSTLVFSSNGHPGLGGLDFFLTQKRGNSWTPPKNLGIPLNSPGDDFGITSRNDLESGYLSSNRSNQQGMEQIYHFQNKKSRRPRSIPLVVQVLYELDRRPIKGAVIDLLHRDTGSQRPMVTNNQGRSIRELDWGQPYRLEASWKGEWLDSAWIWPGHYYGKDTLRLTFLYRTPRIILQGHTLVEGTRQPLPLTKVVLENKGTGDEKALRSSRKSGFYRFELDFGQAYTLSGFKPSFFSSFRNLTTQTDQPARTVVIEIDLLFNKVGENSVFQLKNIYYDFDKWNIRPDAARELNNLLAFLKTHPNAVIELSSHTDCRGSDTYNEWLSQKRAASAVAYLIERGIAPERLQAAGYGEYRLTNGCDDGVSCTEAQHQANRRTEVKILKW